MKKYFFSLLTLLSASLTALPVFNPADPSLYRESLFFCGDLPVNFRGGFYGDYVFNRVLRNRKSPRVLDKRVLDHTYLNTNAGYLVLNFCNRFDLFGSLGMSDLTLEGNISSFSPFAQFLFTSVRGTRASFESRSEFSWSVGGRAVLWQWCRTTLGLEGQFFRTTPHIKLAKFGGVTSDYPNRPSLHAEYHEWQVGLGISHQIACLFPYLAVKWSGSRLHFKNTLRDNIFLFPPFLSGQLLFPSAIVTLNDLVNKKYWGYAVGCTLLDHGRSSITVEGRFGDEKAFHINGQIRF